MGKAISIIIVLLLIGCDDVQTDEQKLNKLNYPAKCMYYYKIYTGEHYYVIIDSKGKIIKIFTGYNTPFKNGQIINKP